MKIALMTNNYKPFVGGVPISIERLATGLIELGHEVTIFAPSYKEQKAEECVFRYRTLIEGVAGGIVVPSPIDSRIEKEFQKNRYDIIHVHHPMLIGKTAVHLAKKHHIPLVFTYHTRYEQYLHYLLPKAVWNRRRSMQDINGILAKYLKFFLRNCQYVFVPTKGMQSYLEETSLYRGNISVLPTGLDKSSFIVSEEEKTWIRKFYKAEGIPLFCTVSRIAPEKNIPFLLDSIRRFKEKYQYSFKVLIIGEGPARMEYEKMCEDLGIGENVVFTGTIPNHRLAAYYGAADMFCFASKSETQGIVLLESFAAGTPVIGVEASGVSDLVIDQVNGCLVPEDTDVFSDKMLLPVTDGMLFKKLRKGAIETARNYKESIVATAAVTQYNKVITEYHLERETKGQEAEKWKINIVS